MDETIKKLNKTTSDGSRSYSKPVITKIQLVAEEAVLANCKLGTLISQDTCEDVFHTSCVQAQTS